MRSPIRLLLVVLACSAPARALAACDAFLLNQFLAAAQSLDAQAESLGQQLLACPQDYYRQTTVYWLSFVYAMEQEPTRGKDLGRSIASSGTTSEKGTLLYRAWQGDTSELAQRVRDGQRGYADDPSTVLVLARNLIRSEQFRDGLALYEQLISLQDDNEVFEIERLYAWIWSQDEEAALLRIAALKRFQLSASLRQAIDRAETLLEKRGHRKVDAKAARQSPWLSLAGQDWVDLRGYRRRTLAVDYQGLLHANAAAHELSHPLESERQKEASLQLGYTLRFGSSWRLLTELGYFSAGMHNATGRLENFIQIGESSLGFGVRREALALTEEPLVSRKLGLMRDTAKAGVSLGRRFIVTAALARDEQETAFAQYQSEWRLGTLVNEETEQGLGFFVPLEFTDHPKPSAAMLSYPREWKAGLGIRAAYGDGEFWALSGDMRILSIHRSYFQDPDSYSKLLGANVRVEAKYFVQRSWYVFAEGERSFVEKNPFDEEDENRSLVVLGVALTGSSYESPSKEMGR